jgi:hypothetical protein
MPLTFPQANANEKENCKNIIACDLKNQGLGFRV